MAKKPFIPIPPMAELPPAEEIDVRDILEKYFSGEIDLICVLGPTASGKTRYAVRLARQINELLGQMGDSGLSDVRFAHPTAALCLRSPRFRAAGGTVLNYHPLPHWNTKQLIFNFSKLFSKNACRYQNNAYLCNTETK